MYHQMGISPHSGSRNRSDPDGAHSRSVHVASPARFQICNSPTPSHKSKKMLPRKRDASQSHTKGPFSGPALTIMSFNVEGLSAAKVQLIADLGKRHLCAVVCIQETHRGPDAIRPSIPGMDLAIERPHLQYGSAIFVTSGTIVNTTSLTDINNIEILRVDLNGISVTSVYKPPGERFSFHQPLPAVGDQQQVITGDFNSHSSTWGYAMTNTDGELGREPKIEPDSRPQASQLFQQRSMATRVQP